MGEPITRTISIRPDPSVITTTMALASYVEQEIEQAMCGGILCGRSVRIGCRVSPASALSPIDVTFEYWPAVLGPQDWQRDEGPTERKRG